MRHNSRRHELKKADRTGPELHKPILQMFIICSYMSKSKTGQPGPYQPPVDRRAASRRDRPQNRSQTAYLPFLRFLAFLRLSASFCAFCGFRIFFDTGRSTTSLFCAVRHGSTGSSHHELNSMERPTPNNSIRCNAACNKLLHTESAKICSNCTKLP